MSEAAFDPYTVLGVAPDVSDIELRRVYRALVQRHHPDHNGGSLESATRFAQIQRAYAAIAQRRHGPAADPAPASADPRLDERVAALERELAAQRAAQARQAREQERMAREQARLVREQAARRDAGWRAPAQSHRLRATPEELGYYTTDDSFTKIIDDAAEQLGQRLRGGTAKKPFARRLSDLFGRGD